jgi:HlyD family secretion protein
MKKRWIAAGCLLLVAAAAGGGYWYYTNQTVQSTENAVYVTSVASMNASDNGYINRYAGVVEAQETVEVKIESGRNVKEVNVKTGDVVKQGQLLFEYDLSSIEEDLQEANLDLDKLKNEATSLEDQITTLEKEQKKASQDNQLSYTIEIETAKMNLKKNEYDQVSKQAQIERLENATKNIEVRSEIDGIIQKIDTSQLNSGDDDSVQDTLDSSGSSLDYGDDSGSNAFITILSTGEYRVKGTVNELNINSIVEGEPIVIRSRADETQVWYGTMGTIDRENPSSSSSSSYWYSDSSDSDTNSSTYPFYVDLDSSDGLMLGQHVYIEPDNGQEDVKTGVWISEFYIVDTDTASPYVWAANEKERLEKRSVVLGEYDEALGEYEIVSGLTEDDYIAFPDDTLEEGLPTTTDMSAMYDSIEELDDSVYDDSLYMEDTDWDDLDDWDNLDDAEIYEDDQMQELEDADEIYEEIDETYEDMEDGSVIDESGDAEVYEDYSQEDKNSDEDDTLMPVVGDEWEDLG